MTWQRLASNILLCIAHPILAVQSALDIESEKLMKAALEREAVSPSREKGN